MVEKLVENKNTVALFANKNAEKSNIIFAASKNVKSIGMDAILKESIKLINGKGGGHKFLAQGSGENKKLEESLEIAVKIIKYNEEKIMAELI